MSEKRNKAQRRHRHERRMRHAERAAWLRSEGIQQQSPKPLGPPNRYVRRYPKLTPFGRVVVGFAWALIVAVSLLLVRVLL